MIHLVDFISLCNFYTSSSSSCSSSSSSSSSCSSTASWPPSRAERRLACSCSCISSRSACRWINWVSVSGTPVSQGCCRHSAAVARCSGSNASIGWRNSAKSRASSTSHSYFSVSTSNSPHGFSFVMWRSSPKKKKQQIYHQIIQTTLDWKKKNNTHLSCWKRRENICPKRQYVSGYLPIVQ